MNKRQNKKIIKKRNKKLIEKYPFLLPRNVYTDRVPKNYNYSYTELDAMPEGWKKAFGIFICEDIKNALLECSDSSALDKYRIHQIKEKYGELRWYSNFDTEKTSEIRMKYEHLSKYTCINCGKIGVSVFDDGWVSPYCDNCYTKILTRKKKYFSKIGEDFNDNIEDYRCKDEEFKPTFKITRFSTKGNETTTYDISDILEKIKKR